MTPQRPKKLASRPLVVAAAVSQFAASFLQIEAVACLLVVASCAREEGHNRPCADLAAELVKCKKHEVSTLPRPEEEPEWTIAAADLDRHPIEGRLGIPLGQVADVQAVIVAGSTLGGKQLASSYLLSVQQVDGRALDGSSPFAFSLAPGSAARLATNAFELHKLRRGTAAHSIDDQVRATLEDGYVGASFRLLVFETGFFAGIPAKVPVDVPVWQDTAFHFQTELVLLKEQDRRP